MGYIVSRSTLLKHQEDPKSLEYIKVIQRKKNNVFFFEHCQIITRIVCVADLHAEMNAWIDLSLIGETRVAVVRG